MSNRRFEMHQYRHVLVRMRLGESDRAIAHTGLMGRQKVGEFRARAKGHGWLDPGTPLPEESTLVEVLGKSSAQEPIPSLVAPHQEEVARWWGEGIQGTTIHQALVRKYNFQGSYSSVRRFLQGLEEAHPEVTTVLDFAPGQMAQVDFGTGPRIEDAYTGAVLSTWIFVMVLAWSRHLYAEVVLDQKVSTWLSCHRHAFESFGGVPARVMVDNLKSAVTRACYYDPEVQRSYAACAEGYGFLILPCPPRDPKKKGRVESGVKYVKNAFLPLRTFRGLGDANRQLRQWALAEAGNRIHGTTREMPSTRFFQTERHLLHPLPDIPPEEATWARLKVQGDCHVQFELCYYSVPFRLVRQILWLRASDTSVRIFQDHELVAVHPRLTQPGSRSTLQDHLPPEARAFLMHDRQWCLAQASRVGPACRETIDRLFAHRVLDNLRAAQGIVGLERRFGSHRLEAACARAVAFDSPLYRTVKAILHRGQDQDTVTQLAVAGLKGPYTGRGRFCRDTSLMLNN